jgi:hypothetical protein
MMLPRTSLAAQRLRRWIQKCQHFAQRHIMYAEHGVGHPRHLLSAKTRNLSRTLVPGAICDYDASF